MENYMDKYNSPEEFIRAEVIANRGVDSNVSKDQLIMVIDLSTTTQIEGLAKKTKAELFDLLIELIGNEAYTAFPVGVVSIAYQQKFGIEHKDVKKMEKAGFITVTGKRRFRAYGKNRYAPVYDPYEYFRLTPDEVRSWLAAHATKHNAPSLSTT